MRWIGSYDNRFTTDLTPGNRGGNASSFSFSLRFLIFSCRGISRILPERSCVWVAYWAGYLLAALGAFN